MKKILLVLGLLFLFSCNENKNNKYNLQSNVEEVTLVPLFKEGDIVYLKPDSTKCVIWEKPDIFPNYIRYQITYNIQGQRVNNVIRECEIFGK